ncbi:MAG: polysaccharide deacetylase family protein [Thermodesulfovibrionales bacterium]
MIRALLLAALCLLHPAAALAETRDSGLSGVSVPVLLYHRFGPSVTDSMTVTTDAFESHLTYMKAKGHTVITLRDLAEYSLGKGKMPRPRSVVITLDDGHKSVYTDLFPLIKKYRLPVTLFIYPSAISKAPYALTWDQLREMQGSGLVDIQGHTFWHPNFIKEKKRLGPTEYAAFARMQFSMAKTKLEKELGKTIDMMAWPFGIYDEELIRLAGEAGYKAAFTMERRNAGPHEKSMALPRYLITGAGREKSIAPILDPALKNMAAGNRP